MSNENIQLKTISEKINNAKNIVITTHTTPDGDALGSVCAMLLALQKKGMDVCAVMETYPNKLNDVPCAKTLTSSFPHDKEIDLLICLDCADKSRIIKYARQFPQRSNFVINIDHHKSNTMFGDLNYIDIEASATCEIVYELLSNYYEIDTDIASCIYTGIVTDSGGFRHPSTTPRTHLVASELLSYGVPFTKIFKQQFHTTELVEAKLLALAIDNLQQEALGQITHTSLTIAEMESVGGNPIQLDGIVEYMKEIKGTKIALFVYDKINGEVKISLRSEDDIDVSEICKKYGGGGHKNAAGASFNSTVPMIRNIIVNDLIAFLERS